MSFTATCSTVCRIEVYDTANPSAGLLCAGTSSPGSSGGHHTATCSVEVAQAASMGVDVGAVGQQLVYALSVRGPNIADQDFPDFDVPVGFNQGHVQ